MLLLIRNGVKVHCQSIKRHKSTLRVVVDIQVGDTVMADYIYICTYIDRSAKRYSNQIKAAGDLTR
jgi:hypothetical protein